ncbi:MurR/RpiR family transcriptional regulator [Gryllotalpicola kribbensis]|uniref:MurR/RpiR family transcriptional regulator n=1 Tax=Gryllotalpicola kribbensis TaxID=993084 RepID=A0ABP8AF31_9MICO
MTGTIKDEFFARMDLLSPAEKKVARALLADYPSAGLKSAASLAKTAGTSTPTVLRLLSRLDIGTYPEFQERLRQELSGRGNSPVSRAEKSISSTPETALDRSLIARSEVVRTVLETVPPGEFDAAVKTIAASERIVISGGYFSRYIARILGLQLDQLQGGVTVAEEPLGRDAALYFGLDRNATAIVFDMRRYETTARKIVTLAKNRGARVLLITDEELSPAAEDADIVLPVRVDAAPFDTFVAVLALTESLVDATFRTIGEPALQRMREWEESVQISRTVRQEQASS